MTKSIERSSGVLLHLTSLPGPHFNGDLGKEAYNFVDFLAESGQRYWQMLPINPIGEGNSPYSTISSMAGEALLIDILALHNMGLLTKKQIKKPRGNDQKKVSYPKARKFREPLLRAASKAFYERKDLCESAEFKAFKNENQQWLADFTLFAALAEQFKTVCWDEWPKELRLRKPDALEKAKLQPKIREKMAYHVFLQFIFAKQWQALRKYANSKGIGLIGDIPIFVALPSADVWAHQNCFFLNKDGSPKFVAGVPPDYFNKDGQLWGNALYDWSALQKAGFSFWIKRLRRMVELFDVVRIDHFIGFYRYWEISAKAKNAKKGKWRIVPGHEFFAAVQKALGNLPFIAEDLGLVTPEVMALRDAFELPGMRVLEFGFGNNASSNYHLPEAYVRNCVAYTGTHDNNTCVGWFDDAKRQSKKKNPSYNFPKILSYLDCNRKNVHTKMMEKVLQSKADLCVVQAQDIFGLDGRSQMNKPGTPKGNWQWRLEDKYLKKSATNAKWLRTQIGKARR